MSRTMVNLRWLAAGILSFGLVGHAHAVLLLDQIFVAGKNQTAFVTPMTTYQQGVTAGKDGILSQVDILYSGMGGPGPIDFFVIPGAPWQSDWEVVAGVDGFRMTLDNLNVGSPEWISINVSSANIALIADITQFTIGLSGNTGGGSPRFIGDLAGNGYTRGSLFVNSSEQTQSDINFKTFVGISIPEPTSLVLLFIGLTGLVFVRPLGH